MLTPPTAYQGGKQRLAPQILDTISPDGPFYDMCCGSGAISVELINREYNPHNIFMVDNGPWGLFWQTVGERNFDLLKFKAQCAAVPTDLHKVRDYVKELSSLPADIETVYVFLILQAASFGSKAIWIKDNKWQNCSFRSFWQPTATSNRKSHVNPMMPMPQTLYERVAAICDKMKGVTGYYGDVWDVMPADGTLYIDPPYEGTTMYGHKLNLMKYVSALTIPCYVSEGKCLPHAECTLLSSGRKKGGISGVRSAANEEWLCYFKPGELNASLYSDHPQQH